MTSTETARPRALAVAPSLEEAMRARCQLFSAESVGRLLRATSAHPQFFPLIRSLLTDDEIALSSDRMPQLLREIGLLISGGLEIHIEGLQLVSMGWFIAFCAEAIEKQQSLCAWSPGRDG